MPETDTKLEERMEAIADNPVVSQALRDWYAGDATKDDVIRAILSSPAFKEMIAEARGDFLAELDGGGNFANWLNACDDVLHHGLNTENVKLREAIDTLQQSMPTTGFREMASAIRARSDAVPASLPVGEGWQVVPKEPTEEMCAAYGAPFNEADAQRNEASYRAMLAAAPPPPKDTITEERDEHA